MKSQKGYTLTELVIVLVFLASIALIGAAGYAVVHFIAKVW